MYHAEMSFFAPDHFVDDRDVGLDYLDYYCRYVFAGVDVDGCAVMVVAVHFDGCVDGLEETFFVDARKDESGFVEAFGSLGGCADAYCGERMADGGEE